MTSHPARKSWAGLAIKQFVAGSLPPPRSIIASGAMDTPPTLR